MANELFYKVLKADIPTIIKEKGYAFFSNGCYNLNIIGIRKNNNNKITNKYDDILCVMYKDHTGWIKKQMAIQHITIVPWALAQDWGLIPDTLTSA